MGPITIEQMFLNILGELDHARNGFSEAASWARSDWTDRRSLTDEEVAARTAIWEAIQAGKVSIDQTKGAILAALDSAPKRGPR